VLSGIVKTASLKRKAHEERHTEEYRKARMEKSHAEQKAAVTQK
jgi:hypothetical protein